jgi:hypothetical protein
MECGMKWKHEGGAQSGRSSVVCFIECRKHEYICRTLLAQLIHYASTFYAGVNPA